MPRDVPLVNASLDKAPILEVFSLALCKTKSSEHLSAQRAIGHVPCDIPLSGERSLQTSLGFTVQEVGSIQTEKVRLPPQQSVTSCQLRATTYTSANSVQLFWEPEVGSQETSRAIFLC